MAWKLLLFFALILTFTRAIEIQHAPQIKYIAPALLKAAPVAVKTIEYEDGPAEYEFTYSVHDPHTGDIKSQKESRKGHRVEGSYELIDPDGYRRLVEYTADEHSGFNAIVHREPTDIKIPQPEPHHKLLIAAPKYVAPAPKLLAAPIVHYAPAPKLIAPVTKVYAAPVAKITSEAGTHVSFTAPAVSYHY